MDADYVCATIVDAEIKHTENGFYIIPKQSEFKSSCGGAYIVQYDENGVITGYERVPEC